MFKTDLPAILNVALWFPTTLASSVRADYGKPGDPDRDQWFWLRGDTFALAVLLAFIMMQAQITTPLPGGNALIPRLAPSTTIFPAGWGVFRYHRCALRLPDRTHFCRHGEAILAGVMALVNFESVSEHVAMQHNTRMVGVGMVVVFGLLNAIGVGSIWQGGSVSAFGMWTTLTIFGLPCGILLSPIHHHSGGLAHQQSSVIFLVCLVILAWRCLCSSVVKLVRANGAGN